MSLNIQTLVDNFRAKGKIYKKIQEVSPKELAIRNKIKMYFATDTSNKFWSIFAVSQKSRLLMKDVQKFEEINAKLSLYCEKDFQYKAIFIDAPLCSKAKAAFEKSGWKIQ